MEDKELNEQEKEALKYAVDTLEDPSFTIKLINLMGKPVENIFKRVPKNISNGVMKAVDKALWLAIESTSKTFSSADNLPASNTLHKILVGFTGGASGALGMAALTVELPITTAIMLRSIMDIARSEGEDINLPDTKTACLTVFALGGANKKDDGAETGYYAVRTALSAGVNDAVKYFAHIGSNGFAERSAPALVRFLSQLSERFGVTVSQKVMAQAVPVIGALGGAAINCLFMAHFQDMARGHFIIRRLERKYGELFVKNKYAEIKAKK